MKRALVALCLVPLTGCAGLQQIPGFAGISHVGAAPRIVCTLKGKAELVQEGVAGIAVTTPLADADELCLGLVPPKP